MKVLCSALSEERPDAVRALGRHQPTKFQRPGALDAELVAPRPESPRELMQAMLVGEADGAVHLVHDVADLAGGLADPEFRGARGESEITGSRGRDGGSDRNTSGRHLLR